MKQVHIMTRCHGKGGLFTISAQSRTAIPSNLPAENHLLVYGPGTAWWRRLDIVGVVLEHGHTLYAGQEKIGGKGGHGYPLQRDSILYIHMQQCYLLYVYLCTQA